MVVAVPLYQTPLFFTAWKKFPSSDLSRISSYKPTTKPLFQTTHDDDDDSQLKFYRNLFDGHFVSNRFTFLFDASHKISTIREGKQIHGQAIITGLDGDVYAQRSLVRMYAKFGECDHASWVLARCSEADIISQNELIAGYIRIGELEAARRVFDEMVERNVVSWSIMVDGYCKNGQIEIAQNLFDEMPERNQFSWNSLITGYLKCGNVEVAETLFDRMPEKNVVAWTTMISGYTKNLLFKEALELFFEMQDSSVKPNRITFISVLPAISELGALTQGRWIHSYVDRKGIRLDGALGSALIDMYCKCGCIDEAIAVFEKLKHKGLSAWNSIILGLAAHGRGRDALRIFSRMQKYSSVTPNEITFTCVLSACSHAGLVNEGWKMFNLFTKFYKLAPNVRHYGCMVDLLSRAGLLEEAMELIEKMPMKSNLVIWKTLLGACRIHKNVELAKHISRIAAGSGSRDSGFYALLSNVFSEAEHWDDMGKVRQEMNDLDVRKVAGCSWVEVDGVVHEFFSGGEGFHARGIEIQYVVEILERLIRVEMFGTVSN